MKTDSKAGPAVTDTGGKPMYKVRRKPAAKGGSRCCLTPRVEAEFRRLYPVSFGYEISRMFGICPRTARKLARELGIAQDMDVIHRRRGALVRAANEANGFFERKRREGMPPQCREAARRRMTGDTNLFRRMKADDPERFAAVVRSRTEARNRTIGSERRRIRAGLDRKTRLNMVHIAYTKTQTSHRYAAFKRGYVLGDTREDMGERYTIYWDEGTERTPLFERNLQRAGFTLRELPRPKPRRVPRWKLDAAGDDE